MRTARGSLQGPRTQVVIGIAVAMVLVGGCSTPGAAAMNAQEQAAYETALERRIQGYVYEMNCRALLPMAEQLLWDKGYRQLEKGQEQPGLHTEWRDDDEGQRRIRYVVYAHDAGGQRCALQFVRHEKGGVQALERRDVFQELELIEFVDEEEARRLRDRALQEAEDRDDTKQERRSE